MHFYQFNIGDYAKATRHLNNLEDLAYRRLMDLYYDSEKALPSDVKKLARLVNMRENEEEIKTVLDDFFFLESDEYHQNRIEREIDDYQAKAETARVNGKKGGRPRKTKQVNLANQEETQLVNLANPEETGSKAKQELRTKKQETLTKKQETDIGEKPKRFIAPDINLVSEYFESYAIEKGVFITRDEPQYFIDFYQSKNWMVGKAKMKDWKAAARNWFKNIKQQGQGKKGLRQDVNKIDHSLPENYTW